MNEHVALPFDKAERTGADGRAVEAGISHPEGRARRLRKPAFGHLLLERFLAQEVGGQDPHGPGVDGGRIEALVDDPHGIGVRDLDALDGLEVGAARR